MSASVWAPGSELVVVDAESTNLSQVFSATASQTLFNLTEFSYTVGTGSVAVYRGGQRLILGTDWSETSSTSITLIGIVLAADETIEVVAVIGSASASALAAANSAAEAAASAAALASSILPNQAGQASKYLQTNGSVTSWQDVVTLPPQTGNSGKYLTTDGTNASWATISSVTLDGIETLTNKTLTTPDINTSLNFVGTSGKIQVGGVDKVVIGTQGIESGSFKPGAIKPVDLAGGSGTGNLTSYTTATTPLPAAGSNLTHSHSLGFVPVEVVLEITCLTAEHNYAVGDVIAIYMWWNGGASIPLHNLWKNSTQVGTIQPAAYTFFILNKTTGANVTPTAANWSYRFRLRAA